MLSSHIRLGPDGDAGPVADTAAALGDEKAWIWRSSFSRHRTTPPCWPRSPGPSPSSADAACRPEATKSAQGHP